MKKLSSLLLSASLLASGAVQAQGVPPPANVRPLVEHKIVKTGGSSVEIFAFDFFMAPSQRLEPREIFETARDYCRSVAITAKLTKNEPAVFMDKGQQRAGTLLTYACLRGVS